MTNEPTPEEIERVAQELFAFTHSPLYWHDTIQSPWLEMAKRHLAQLAQVTNERDELVAQVAHPQIHVDYYQWLSGLTEEQKHFMATATPNGIAMWAWSVSREKVKEKMLHPTPPTPP